MPQLVNISYIATIVLAKATVLLALATVALAVGAFIAAKYAKNNVDVLRKRDRYNIISKLLEKMNERDARKNKATIHQQWQARGWNTQDNSKVGESIYELFKRIWAADAKGNMTVDSEDRNLKDAIEETVALLDTMGYSIIENKDREILNETPIQFWSVGDDMWKKLRFFVLIRREKEVWGTYFEELGNEAPKHLR
ncbi:MAG: hypothetical protein Q8O05_01475 [Chloroflexota bacterium]|nr:hypothetical protein [Chloroflexota bacterium]